MENKEKSGRIAVVGMAGRFPGAGSVDELWGLIRDGREGIVRFEEKDLEKDSWYTLRSDAQKVFAAAPLENVELFDARFFGYSPNEAKALDPQHRIFLECTWHALENSGHTPADAKGRIGVYAGTGMNTYLLQNLLRNSSAVKGMDPFARTIMTDKDYLALRVSYALDIRGPSFTVQASCSTSLLAVHQACLALRAGECDIAIAGGVNVSLPQYTGHAYEEGSVLTKDGHIRVFDADASGTLFGNGSCVLVLRRLEDAVSDGDNIFAQIVGMALNNDGKRKGSFAAPSREGQAEVVRMALDDTGFDARSISLVETHGTGTVVGDPIEVSALTEAFRKDTDDVGFCSLGSIKANVGHLNAAAGVTGLLKSILCLHHRYQPPQINVAELNPRLEIESSPFEILREGREWPAGSVPRRAGVTSLGVGGTNIHAIMEEAPAPPPGAPSPRPAELVTLSGRTTGARDSLVDSYTSLLEEPDAPDLADAAFTAAVGRVEFPCRAALVFRGDNGGAGGSSGERVIRRVTADHVEGVKPVAFLVPGQGMYRQGMGSRLYREWPLFRREIEACAALLPDDLPDLRGAFGEDGSPDGAEWGRPSRLQPLQFSFLYALAKLWLHLGVRPSAMAGHSFGEYVVGCIAGVMPLEDMLRFVAARGRLCESVEPGAMTALSLPAGDVEELLGSDLSIAAVNAPRLCTVAGPEGAVAELEKVLAARDVTASRLDIDRAYHSAMLEPIAADLTREAAAMRLSPPSIPFATARTGEWIDDAAAVDPGHWTALTTETVHFSRALGTLAGRAEDAWLEVGPGRALAALARIHDRRRTVLSTLPHPDRSSTESEQLLGAIGEAWVRGLPVDRGAIFEGEARRRVVLPGYPFERQRHWVEPSRRTEQKVEEEEGRRKDPEHWFYRPVWMPDTEPVENRSPKGEGTWLLIADEEKHLAFAAHGLGPEGAVILRALKGREFRQGGEGQWEGDFTDASQADALAAALAERGTVPTAIVDLRALSAPAGADVDSSVGLFMGLLNISRAFAKHSDGEFEVSVVTRGVQAVTDAEGVALPGGVLPGLMTVIAQEFQKITVRNIDLPLEEGVTSGKTLAGELARTPDEKIIALRGTQRWYSQWVPHTLGPLERGAELLRQGGTYWITGGLGNIGLTVAHELALRARANIVLSSRSGLPPREEWPGILAAAPGGDRDARRIRRITEIEKAGGTVHVLPADVSDPASMKKAVETIRSRWDGPAGVIHAAGSISHSEFRLLNDTDADRCRNYLSNTIRGTENLSTALEGTSPDFVILAASLSSILGGLQYGVYAAASRYLDGAAHFCRQSSGNRWNSLNWDQWLPEEGGEHGVHDELETYAIGQIEGREAWLRALQCIDLPRAAVSTWALGPRIRRWVDEGGRGEDSGQESKEGHSRPELAVSYEAPQSDLERTISKIFELVLGVDGVGTRDDFYELGGHSLLGVKLCSDMQSKFGVELSLTDIMLYPTVKDLAGLVEGEPEADGTEAGKPEADGTEAGKEEPQAPARPQIRPGTRTCPDNCILLNAVEEGIPLFCVPGAGSDVTALRDIALNFGGRPFFGMQYPGIDGRGEPLETIEEVAARHVAAILEVCPAGPIFIAGTSTGGVVSYEISRQLEAAGRRPAFLGLIDTLSPLPLVGREGLGPWERMQVRLHRLLPAGGGDLNLTDLKAGLRQKMRLLRARRVAARSRARGEPVPISHRFWHVLDYNLRAHLSYRPGKYGGDVVVYRAEERDLASLYLQMPAYGWGLLVEGEIAERFIPGVHMEHIRGGNAAALAASLDEEIGKACAVST